MMMIDVGVDLADIDVFDDDIFSEEESFDDRGPKSDSDCLSRLLRRSLPKSSLPFSAGDYCFISLFNPDNVPNFRSRGKTL